MTKQLGPPRKRVVKDILNPQLVSKEKMPFVELMGRSNFSFLRGASHPEEMVEQAILFGYEGLGLCDLDGLYGVARGYQTYKSPSLFTASTHAHGDFRYLIGTEVTLTDQEPLVLMPLNKKGYTDLCAILTLGKRQAAKGHSRLKLSDLRGYTDDLLAFPLPPWKDECLEILEELFVDRLYLPVWRDFTWESLQFYRQALHYETHWNLPLFVTQRPFMHTPDRKPLFDVMTCILHGKQMNSCKDILIQNRTRHLHSLTDLLDLWQDRPDLLKRTCEIASRVNFSLSEIRYRYPRSNLPADSNPTTYLKELVQQGLNFHFPDGISEKLKKQVEHELQVIAELEYEDYFLTLREICEFAKKQNILFQGRGSAANSIVCFALGLTAVNPTQVDLLFERFISIERREPPDIDIDFEHERREEVIQHIYNKYGEQHAAMVCTVIRYKTRMAFRETAKVFGIPISHINVMAKYMGREGMPKLVEDPEYVRQFGIDYKEFNKVIAMAVQLKGAPRHLGIHTGGFLITQDPMIEMVPVEKATMDGRYVIQWNKDDVATLGLMKIDVLSLGMLTCIRKCFDLLREHKKIDMNLVKIPQDDQPTYKMIQEADTVGTFQIESRAQMATLPRLRPENFYDLVVEVAIVRPGPLQGGMVHPYLRRRQGLEKVEYAHPALEDILCKTMGVPIFQEQIMRMVVAVAGFTPGEADEMRRIMASSWRKKAVVDGLQARIMRGLLASGISQDYAEKVYRTIEGFASYGFPESHSASFAILTYASCWLKQHHPDVFTCALLNSQPMGFYSPRALLADAQRHGVSVLPLDIQKSTYDFSLEPGANSLLDIRVGLRSLYGLGSPVLKELEKERLQRGPFLNLQDFIQRVKLPRSALMKLAASGALQSFSKNPRDLLWYLQSINLDQKSFLWGQPYETFADEESDTLPEEDRWQEMEREYETKGFSTHTHPLTILRATLDEKSRFYVSHKKVPYYIASEQKKLRHGCKIRVAGLLSLIQKPPTAKGFCFLTIEDETGIFNIVLKPDIYKKFRDVLYSCSLLEIQGTLENVAGVINIKAENILEIRKEHSADSFSPQIY